MSKNPTIEEILTPSELARITDLRIDLLRSVTKFEREYYVEEINQIINKAKERYFKSQSNAQMG